MKPEPTFVPSSTRRILAKLWTICTEVGAAVCVAMPIAVWGSVHNHLFDVWWTLRMRKHVKACATGDGHNWYVLRDDYVTSTKTFACMQCPARHEQKLKQEHSSSER